MDNTNTSSKSKIASQEGYFYVFDSLPLLMAVALFLVICPPCCFDDSVAGGLEVYPLAGKRESVRSEVLV